MVEFLQLIILEKNSDSKTVSMLFESAARIPHFSPMWESICVHALTQSPLFKGSLYQDFTFRFSWPGTGVLMSLSRRLSPFFSQDIPGPTPQSPRVDQNLSHDSPAPLQPELPAITRKDLRAGCTSSCCGD